jgi:pimeloyl-ACP methyl ester carboxylesterase
MMRSLLNWFPQAIRRFVNRRRALQRSARRPAPRLRLRAEELTPRILPSADDVISGAFALGAMAQTRTRGGEAIDPGTDVDLVSFTVAAGQRIAFDLDRPSGSLDSYFRLFNGSGTALASNDDGPTPGEPSSYESYLEYTFNSAGTFYLAVSGFGNTSYDPVTGAGHTNGSTGAYTLILTPLSAGNSDADDQISEAFPLGAMTQTRTRAGEAISPGTDVDMLSLTVVAGQRIAFDIDQASSPGIDSYLRLFTASGAQLAANDDGAAPGEPFSYESYLEYTFNSAGTFYLGVSGYGNSGYDPTTGAGDSNGSTGAYSLTVTPLTAGNSDDNDQIAEAVALGPVTQNRTWPLGTIDAPTDVDMFSFSVAAGQRLAFDIDRPSGSLDSYIRLFSGNGTPLASNDDGPTPGEPSSYESYLEYTFNSAGTFYLAVSGFGNSAYDPTTGAGDSSGSTGAYSLIVSPIALVGQVANNGVAKTVSIRPFGGGTTPIYTDRTTWIVIHGMNGSPGSSSDRNSIYGLSGVIDGYAVGDQVLVLDWSSAAVSSAGGAGGEGEDYITPVGRWAASALAAYGLPGWRLNLVGHSWGAYVAAEMAEGFGEVNSIVALDPAANHPMGNYNPEWPGEVDFARNSRFSWAFFESGTDPWGSTITPLRADESFVVRGSSHTAIVGAFANLLSLGPDNNIGSRFRLEWLLNDWASTSWSPNRYDNAGNRSDYGGWYEAVLAADSTGEAVRSLRYFDGQTERTWYA